MSYKENILKLRSEGKTYNEIVSELGCSKATVSYHCSARDDFKLVKDRRKKDLSALQGNKKLNFLLEQGICKKNIAEALGLSYKDVLIYAKHLGLAKVKLTGYDRVKERRRHLKLLGIAYLGGSCKHCGYCKSTRALHFHHVNPDEKDFTVSSIANRAWSRIKSELNKCILLCANCHAEEHDRIDLLKYK